MSVEVKDEELKNQKKEEEEGPVTIDMSDVMMYLTSMTLPQTDEKLAKLAKKQETKQRGGLSSLVPDVTIGGRYTAPKIAKFNNTSNILEDMFIHVMNTLAVKLDGIKMSSTPMESIIPFETFSKVMELEETQKILAKLKEYILPSPDASRYQEALNLINQTTISKTYKKLTPIFRSAKGPIVIVPVLQFDDGFAELVRRIVADVNGLGDKYTIGRSIFDFIAKKASEFEKFGYSLKTIMDILSSPVTVEQEKLEKIRAGVKAGIGTAGAGISAGAGVERIDREKISFIRTRESFLRVLSMVLRKGSDDPMILELNKDELKMLGADFLVNTLSNVSNSKLVILVYLYSAPRSLKKDKKAQEEEDRENYEELAKLVSSDTVSSLAVPIVKNTTHNQIVNFYQQLKNDIDPQFRIVGKRKMRTNIAYTIKLLQKTQVLQRMINKFLVKYNDPLLTVYATNKAIAYFYSVIRSPRELYNKIYAVREAREEVRKELVRLSDIIMKIVDTEIEVNIIKKTAVVATKILKVSYDEDEILKATKYAIRFGTATAISEYDENGLITALLNLNVLTQRYGKSLDIVEGPLYRNVKELLLSRSVAEAFDEINRMLTSETRRRRRRRKRSAS